MGPSAGVPVGTRGEAARRAPMPGRVIVHALLIAGSLFMVFPFLWAVGTSLKPAGEIFTWPPTMYPAHPQPSNYVDLFVTVPFFAWLRNSVIITGVTAADIASARELGHVVKLLAICERRDGGVSVRAHPAMIPRSHPLAGVREAYNAVFVEAESAGRLMFYGAGAGGVPTASAVLGDVVAVARNLIAGTRGPDASTYAKLPALPMGEARTRYHVSLDVADKPGVLAAVAETYARHDVSIKAVRQEGRGEDAQLVIVTHAAPDAALSRCVTELETMDSVRAVASVMRVEGEGDE